MSDLQYPIGRLKVAEPVSPAQRQAWIREIAAAPDALRQAVAGLTEAQLETPYRPDGWTVRQVVHHLADSHLNAYIRLRLALTEESPTIKPYDENRWANLHDASTGPVAVSLALLDALHDRWVSLLEALSEAEFSRTFLHPEGGTYTVDRLLGVYAWHGRHHIAHVTGLCQRMGW